MDRELGEAWQSHNGWVAAPTNSPKIMANQNSLPMMVDSSWKESNHAVDRNVANQSMSVVYLHSLSDCLKGVIFHLMQPRLQDFFQQFRVIPPDARDNQDFSAFFGQDPKLNCSLSTG